MAEITEIDKRAEDNGLIYRVEIITRPERLETLKEELHKIRVTGMTVSQVYGCGLSGGLRETYRGQEVEITLLPKIKVEIVVCEVSVDDVVDAAIRACRTGAIGDGKVFVSKIKDAVRIRTGDRGPAAIMDRPDEKHLVDEKVGKKRL